MERSIPKVVNTHWFGSVEKLPDNVVYIGRPSPYGNAYSSKSGLYTKEECIARHRVDLYHSLTTNPLYFTQIKYDLEGRDLACWCKQPKRLVGCHGDNYLHVLSNSLKDRLYDKTITHYLMDDLRSVLNKLADRIRIELPQEKYLFLFIHLGDVKLDIQHVLLLCKKNYVHVDDLNVFIATLVIDLELAFYDADLTTIEYRFYHVLWLINRFIRNDKTRNREPLSPYPPLKRIKKVVV